MYKVLIVVDVQNDFVSGSLGSAQAQAIVSNVRLKISDYLKRGDRIVFTRDTHHENYLQSQEGKNLPVEHCVAGTHGWEICSGLDDGCDECTYVDKTSFGWGHWNTTLKGDFDEIELVGLCTDICVVSNALVLKTLFPETKITVDASCCAGVTEESHNAALLTMKMCQVNVINQKGCAECD